MLVSVLCAVCAMAAALLPTGARAQSPVSSSYATKDGRASTVILGCTSTNSTYYAQYCGVAGYPLHVTVDSGTVTVNGASGGGSTPTTTPGTAPSQVVGVQGGGAGALPVSVNATSLPLPAGAATSALQSQIDPNDGGAWVHITNFPSGGGTSGSSSGTVAVSSLPALPTGSNAIGSVSVSNLPTTQMVAGTVAVSNLPATQPVSGTVSIGNLPATQPISGAVAVSSLPALPTGSNAIGSVSVSNLPATQPVSGTISVGNLPATQPVSGTVAVSGLPALPTGSNAIGSVSVSNLPATQPVSGSVSISNLPGTQAVSLSSLPLPSGAATSALQPAINADGGAQVHVMNTGSTNVAGTVSVSNFPSTQPVSGSLGVTSLPALPAGTNAIGSVSVSNLPATQAVSAASLPLPSGAATASGVAAVVTALGSPLQTGGAVSVSNLPSTQAISAASLPLPSGAASAANQSTVISSLSAIVSNTTGLPTGAKQPALNSDGGELAHITNFPATQPVSAAALPLPSGAATAALQAALNADGGGLAHITNFPATQPVSATALPLPSGAATAALQPTLNADGGGLAHITNFPSTQPVSAASLPLPSGAATAALQPALNSDGGALSHIMNFPTTQAVSGSVAVSALPALPSGSNAIGSVSVSNLPTTQTVSGTVAVSGLPALPAGGNAIGSVSVSNLPGTQAVSAQFLPLPAGAATAALQAAVNSDGGSQVHVQNFPAVQTVSLASVAQAARSGAWTDASVTATSTAAVPNALAAVSARTGLHVWNVGTSTVCMNYTSTAAASGTGCAAGSVPIPAGSAYLEDQPGNVSPEAISLVCTAASCPLTIKVR